jgi:hypothetical protein
LRGSQDGRLRERPGTGGDDGCEQAGRRVNDDQSPLLNLMTCMVCKQTMKLEKVDPDVGGNALIQYRCKLCGRIERLRLLRRKRGERPRGRRNEFA